MSDNFSYLKEIWREINTLRQRISELEHDDVAPDTLALRDGATAPAAAAGQALLYVDIADGDLRVKFGDGITKTIATDT